MTLLNKRAFTMAETNWEKLRHDADYGLNGLGSLVEAIRRMDTSSGELASANLRLSQKMVVLSWIMAVSAVAQVALAAVGIWLALK